MTEKAFEIIVRYNSWNVEVYDGCANPLIKLNCKSNGWFSEYISGSTYTASNFLSIQNSDEGIVLTLNNSRIGGVTITSHDLFGRIACIEIASEKYFLERENLKQMFVVTDKSDNVLLSIEGKTYKDKQRNLFGKLFFDDKLYHSVFLSNPPTDKIMFHNLLTICGYCIRVFLEIDMGEYSGEVLPKGRTIR